MNISKLQTEKLYALIPLLLNTFKHYLWCPLMSYLITFFQSQTQYMPYSLWHFYAILSALILLTGLLSLPRTKVIDKVIRISLCLVTCLCLTISCISYHFIPLHVCHVSAWLILPLALLLRVRVFQYLLIYISGWGALIALIIPDLQAHTTWLRFIVFYTMHSCLVISALYCFIVDRPKPEWISVLYVIIAYNVYIFFVGIVDYFLDANYVFLSHPPQSLQNLFTWPWYIFEFQLFFIALSFMTCALGRLYQSRDHRMLKHS